MGTAAPLRAEKNLGRLIKAFAGLPSHLSANLLVIGDGPQRALLERLASAHGAAERVHFVGHTDAVEGYLAHLDVFAMSSDTEQMPSSLLQAMAASLPVIATDVGDVKWILSEDNAPFVVAKHDEAAFAAGLAALLGDPALRARLARANQARVRAEFPEERMFQAYGKIFDELLSTYLLGRSVLQMFGERARVSLHLGPGHRIEIQQKSEPPVTLGHRVQSLRGHDMSREHGCCPCQHQERQRGFQAASSGSIS